VKPSFLSLPDNKVEMQQIGYVLKMFPRLSETFILNEILEMERRGLALRIFSLKRPSATEMGMTDGAVRSTVIYLPDRIWREPLRVLRAQFGVLRHHPRGYGRTLLHVLRGRELRSLGRGLRRFCQTCCLVHEMGPVEHLHAHFATDPTRLASWARMICQVSFSVTTHAKDLYQDNRIASPGLRYKLSAARFVITNSQSSAANLRAAFDGAIPPKICTIYNSLDLSVFPQRLEAPIEPTILGVGRLVEKKGFHDLIKACQFLKDWKVAFGCKIVGSGSLHKSLRDSIENLNLGNEVKLQSQMPQRELRDAYVRAVVFALPCIVAANGDRDILPNVLKEAMAVGVPVVTTRLPGIEELVVHEQSGLLVSPQDPEALAKALQRLLNDGALRQRLATQARKTIETRFELHANFGRLKDLLLDSIGKRETNIVSTQICKEAA
jgi:glycosyltransferase involved in cell wall biosynthesis